MKCQCEVITGCQDLTQGLTLVFCFIYPVTQDSREESITSLSTLGNSVDPLYLVGVGILARPSFTRAVECELSENQFASRHSLDGKFLFIDPKYVMMLYMYIVGASFILFLLFFLSLFEFFVSLSNIFGLKCRCNQFK